MQSHMMIFEGRPKSVQEGSTTARRVYPPASQAVTLQLTVHPLHTLSHLATMALVTSVHTRIRENGNGHDVALSQRDAEEIAILTHADRVSIIIGGRNVPQHCFQEHLSQWGFEESTTVSLILNDKASYGHSTAGDKHGYSAPYTYIDAKMGIDDDTYHGGFDSTNNRNRNQDDLSLNGGSSCTHNADVIAGATTPPPTLVNVGTALAASLDQFMSLIHLCDAATAASMPIDSGDSNYVDELIGLRDKLWHLLQVIPTQEQIENRISLVQEPDWENLLGESSSTSPSLLIYILEVIDHALSPSTEYHLGTKAVAERELERQKQRLAFCEKFVVTGGLQYALDLLCSDGNRHEGHTGRTGDSTSLSGRAVAVILNLLRGLLTDYSRASPVTNEGKQNSSPVRAFPVFNTNEDATIIEEHSVLSHDDAIHVTAMKEVINARGSRIIATLVELAVKAANTGNHSRLTDGFVVINSLFAVSSDLDGQDLLLHPLSSQLVKSTLLSDIVKVRQAGLALSKQLCAISSSSSTSASIDVVESATTTSSGSTTDGRLMCLSWLLDCLEDVRNLNAPVTAGTELFLKP